MPPTLSEAAFQGRIIDLAKLTGWRAHAERPAQFRDGRWATHIQGHAGFLDLVLLRPPRLIFAEVKRSLKGRQATPEQQIWLTQLSAVPGVEVYLWTPEGWDDIVDLLR